MREDRPPRYTYPPRLLVRVCCLALVFASFALVSFNTFCQMTWLHRRNVEIGTVDSPHQVISGTAKSIVHQTYNRVFSHLTGHCLMNTTMGMCLKDAHQRDKPDVPWWFHTMLRDANKNKMTAWHYQSAHNVTKDGNGLRHCVMEKIGTKSWRRLFCHLQGKHPWRPIHCIPDEKVPEDVPRTVFLRDPLERFLSAYLDKCFSPMPSEKQQHCPTSEIFSNPANASFAESLEDNKKLLFEAYVDAIPLQWNIHFFPQSLYCDGLYRHISSYDFRGVMGEKFYEELDRMGQQFGGRMVDGLEKYFDLSKSLNATRSSTNTGVETSAVTQVLEYYSPYSVRRVLEYMSIDYVLLDLPIPEWVNKMLDQDAVDLRSE